MGTRILCLSLIPLDEISLLKCLSLLSFIRLVQQSEHQSYQADKYCSRRLNFFPTVFAPGRIPLFDQVSLLMYQLIDLGVKD